MINGNIYERRQCATDVTQEGSSMCEKGRLTNEEDVHQKAEIPEDLLVLGPAITEVRKGQSTNKKAYILVVGKTSAENILQKRDHSSAPSCSLSSEYNGLPP